MIEQESERLAAELVSLTGTLGRILRLVHLYRQVAGLATGLVIFAGLLAVPIYRNVFGQIVIPSVYISGLFTLSVIAFCALIRYDTLKRAGDAIYEEVSDELQWHLTKKHEKEKTGGKDRPYLATRVLLREYATGTDLPLVPGAYGAALYAIAIIGSLGISVTVIYVPY